MNIAHFLMLSGMGSVFVSTLSGVTDQRIAPWLFAAGIVACVLSALTGCPRCGLNLTIDKRFFQKSHNDKGPDCPQCGRTRKGVWPLQFIFKPEPWDGRHTDG